MPGNGATRRRVVEYVDQHRDELLSFFRELVRIPSVFPHGEYEAISQRMKQEFSALGVRADLVSAPKEKVEKVGLEYPRPNVVALIEGSEKKPILMIGTHMDVVGVGDPDEWRFDPFGAEISDGKVLGRGTCDAKCAMAAQVFVAKAIQDLGIGLKGSLMFVASVDDEGRLEHLKWPGMTFLVEQGFEEAGYSLPNMVINGEASGLESICGSFNGRLLLELEIVGERGHVATRPGVNAIKQAMKFIEALDGVELKQGHLQGRESLNVCAIEGLAEKFGDIPQACKVGLGIRVAAPYSTQRIIDELERIIGGLKETNPDFRVGNINVLSNREPIEIDPREPIVTAIQEAAESIGTEARFSPIGGTGELQAFLTRGIPGVTYGPGSISRVHKANEFLEIDGLVKQTKIYALTALIACGFQET